MLKMESMKKLKGRSIYILVGLLSCVLIIYLQNYISPKREFQAETSFSKTYNEFRNTPKTYQSGAKCNDTLTAAAPALSVLHIQGRRLVFIGEKVRFLVELYNGYGKPKSTGGDHLRARLFNDSLGAYTAGTILDHDNGTYTVTVQALWTGQAQLQVEVLYTKEILITAIRLRRTSDFTDIIGSFSYMNTTENTTCGPDYETVLRYSNVSKVCDFSYWNKSQQWFCGRPKKKLLCKHWVSINRNWENYTKGISQCEDELSKSDRQTTITSNMTLQILPATIYNTYKTTFKGAKIPCSSYNATKLWFKESPTGYFYNNTWNFLHCEGLQNFDVQCIKNKTLMFWGDSTLYQWYNYLKQKLRTGGKSLCRSLTAYNGWRNNEMCKFHKYNTTLWFMGHNIPVFVLEMRNIFSFFAINSFEKAIKARPGKGEDILLILHLFGHIQQYHYNFFTAHILEIKRSLERIYQTKPNVQVFFKLPHTYRRLKDKKWKIRQCDYIGFIYIAIMRKIFEGLYDRVTVLDQKDATIAVRNLKLHPSEEVVREMVNQLLSYACKSDK